MVIMGHQVSLPSVVTQGTKLAGSPLTTVHWERSTATSPPVSELHLEVIQIIFTHISLPGLELVSIRF